MSSHKNKFAGQIFEIPTLLTVARRSLAVMVIVAGFLACTQSAHAQLPTAVGWTALPASTSLEGSGACPPNNFGGDPFLFSEYCENVIRAWNGAVADTTANRLIIWGGGHNNYYGNEIYALNLTANPITLVRLKDPTVPTNFANSQNCIDSIPPGTETTPNSRESYGGMEFIPGAYRMLIMNGSVACLEGDGTANTWSISLSNLSDSTSWVHENPTMTGPNPDTLPGGDSYGNVAAYDPNSGLVFVSDASAIYTYKYSTNTFTAITPAQGFVTDIYLSGAIDPTRKLFVLVGGCNTGGACNPGNGVFVADISNPASTTQQNWTANTMAQPTCAEFLEGGVNPILSGNPGITFDSVANDFVAWPNQGNSVYILTPDVANQRLTCTKQTFANGPPNSAHHSNEPNTSYGTFGRFRYFPAIDAFVLINDWNIPAYVLKLRGSTSSDFSLSTTPSSNSAVQGSSASYSVSVGAIGGFSGAVGLSVSGLPSGATASFTPSSITTSGSSTLSVTAGASTPVGSYTLTITGTSGSLTHTSTVTFGVTAAPNFALSANPTSGSVVQGAKTSYTLTVTAQNGFSGSVALGLTGVPSGSTASFSPTSISGSGSSTLSVTAGAGTPTGSYTLTVTGTSGALSGNASRTASVTFTVTAAPVPSFTLSVSPTSSSVAQGGKASYSVSVSPLNGFTGSVALSVSGAPSGATTEFSPTSITTSGSSTLSVSTTSSTATGSYTLTLTGISGSISQHASATLTVTSGGGGAPSSGVISVNFVGTGTAMASSEVAGVVPESNWNQASGATSSSPMGLVDQNGNATGASISWQADNGYDLPIADQPGNVRMMRGYLDNDAEDTTTITLSGLASVSGGYNVYVYADGSNGATSRTGIYQISGSGITTTSVSLTDLANTNFDGTFVQGNNSPGNYAVFSVNATAFTLAAIPSTSGNSSERAPVNGIQIVPNGQVAPTPTFSLGVSPSSATVTQGGKATYTVTVTPQNEFTGSVSLAASGLPEDATAAFSPSSITTSGTSTLTITTAASTPLSATTFTISGVSGSITRTAQTTLVVAAAAPTAKPISINFVGTDTPMASSEVAGVVAETNWNQAVGASSTTPMALVDDTGAATSATITWKADDIYDLPIADAPGNVRMMRGYLDDETGDTTVITISGLVADANGYTIYLYGDGANGSDSRASLYQISGSGITTTSVGLADLSNTDFDGTFVQANNSAGNYVVFTVNATGFTLSAIPEPSQSGVERAPVNGIQIIPR